MARVRAAASAVLLVLAVVSLPLSIVSGWSRTQLVDEDAFTATLAPLARSAAVQDVVIAASTDAVDARLDADALTGAVVDGIIALGVGDRAADALRRLQAPAAAAVQRLVHETVADAIRSDAFSDAWTQLLRQSHRALTFASTSDGGGLVVQTDAGLGIQVGAVVAALKDRLSAQGIAGARVIPDVDRVVIVGSGDTLTTVRSGYALGVTAGLWLPIATAGLFLGGVLLSRRRLRAVGRAAVASAVAVAVLLAAAAAGRTVAASASTGTVLTPAAAVDVYDQLVAAAVGAAGVLLAVSLAIAAAAWLAGSSARAVALRAAGNRWRARRAAAGEPSDLLTRDARTRDVGESD